MDSASEGRHQAEEWGLASFEGLFPETADRYWEATKAADLAFMEANTFLLEEFRNVMVKDFWLTSGINECLLLCHTYLSVPYLHHSPSGVHYHHSQN